MSIGYAFRPRLRDRLTPVSYTHLDVYKRQVLAAFIYAGTTTVYPELVEEPALSLSKGGLPHTWRVQYRRPRGANCQR